MRDRVEACSTCGANLTDCCRQCLVCVEAGRVERVPCAPDIEAAEGKAAERQRVVSEELAALRAVWWFMNDGMGFTDSGAHASLTWAEVTALGELHDAVEDIYQKHGYPPKPEVTS